MPDIWGIAAILTKLMLYIGVAGSVGLMIIRVAFVSLVSPLRDRIRVQAVLLASLALAASILGFMLRGAALTGGADGMIDPEMLGLLWQTPVGDVLVYRIVGTVLIIIGLFTPLVGQSVALAGGLIALWSFAQIGHVPELEATGVRVLLFLHLLGIAFWIGILGPLRALSRQPENLASAATLGHRFGQAASVIVPALILAGLLMAWLLLGDFRALVETSYGQALLIKLVLVGAVLTMAAANKLRFVPAMQAGDGKAARHLVRSVEIETAVILVVLAATATLTSVLTLPN
ncbi:copper-binding protein [Roseobacter sp. HKCCD9010]|uniref:copper resistance D family protein n=1 Tax=unclassified Roseobacter TaxID=196798 RepID=UPI0014915A32|nr:MULTISPECIES: CopD family protein [unclassified Roseobacter]MBF9049806.1 copper-binding protein [Rhodobacterales bacterium HKCCD4356]NNV13655.1 copper-binding protein [Roseobacter sp. HKCCD7357]NNV16489.1 copper-binding protein [Roseobacter sp. HKCCD8768]NNV25948.1 copper-binding protein [Roseobacter sp. HKCCD8192]NNV30206.1 copper-binding protein [Roseobacter sp. HKCCD9061]